MTNKRTLTYIISAISFFFVGMEYAVIIPTLNEFLLSMDASSSYLGIILSAMNISALFSNLVFGRITDATKKTKALVIIGNLFKIAGSAMYFIAVGPNFLILSRLVVGLGSGSDSSIISMISRSSNPTERTSLMSTVFAGRQAGLVIGPVCNFFLQYFNFSLGSIHINKFTAPGMTRFDAGSSLPSFAANSIELLLSKELNPRPQSAIVWCIHTLLVFFFYYDLEYYIDEDNNLVQEETRSLVNQSIPVEVRRSKCNFLKEVFRDLVSEECVVLLGLTFTLMFVLVGVEALTTPLSYMLLQWGDLENSVYYSVAGVLFVIGLLSLSKVSKFVSDRALVLCGLSLVTANNIMFLVFILFAFNAQGAAWVEAIFILYGVVLCIPFAYAWVPIVSLFTKVTTAKNQGFNQGVRMFCANLGQVIGPLWASSLLNNLTIMASVNVGLLLLLLTMFVCSYKRFLLHESRENSNSVSQEPHHDETEPHDDETEFHDDETELHYDETEPYDDERELYVDKTEPHHDETEPHDDETEPLVPKTTSECENNLKV